MSKASKIKNEFEAKMKITNFPSKEEILEKINSYCNSEKKEGEEERASYDIEKETSNMILLNFGKDTELAYYINRKIKLLQIENSNFSNINCNLKINVKNPKKEKENNENKDTQDNQKKKIKNKNPKNEII